MESVSESNRYAASVTHYQNILRGIHGLPELKAFLGVIINNMSLNPKPEMDDYFSSDWINYQPFFKMIFSKERFYQIYWTHLTCERALLLLVQVLF